MNPTVERVRVEVARNIGGVTAAEWNALRGTEYPFLRHEFLLALEETGCVAPASGWTPCHLLLRDGAGRLLGAMPLYSKTSSFGEFVFDWAWADAYRRAGLRYFPKLVSAVPFTPATSPRLLHAPGQEPDQIGNALLAGATELAREIEASSVHVLFPTSAESALLSRAGFLPRKDCQFHWANRGYADFDAFLGEFTAEKRKKAKRERRRVAEAGISFMRLRGGEIDAALWTRLMPLYASSFWRRGREPYLNEAFFTRVSATLPENVVAIVAMRKGDPVATALCFRSADTLYGRYWGSEGDYHSLHFETCYYQGIEYCIEQGLKPFEPG
ncbi:MAG: GNAT family N-acetyltransferase, partial [Gammaproteobacteria bacterium]|nr:GNAT family N-acetyltransferase [Gammaproteobacteria bacterium]